MNKEKFKNLKQNLINEIEIIEMNVAYINGKDYIGLDTNLLHYIRNLEQTLDKIKKYIRQQQDEQSEQAGFYNAFTEYITINVDDILNIINKMGEVK